MTARPPRLATALLRRCCPSHDALLGDLMETYATGKSSWWYWKEALAALLVCTVADIGQHKVLAARAVASAWVLSWVFFEYAPVFLQADQYLFVTGLAPWFWRTATTCR